MASVTFPVELGGDGNTYSDDDNPTTGLGNDGHRQRFVPCLMNLPPMMGVVVQNAQQARADRLTTNEASAKAVSAKGDAEKPQLRPRPPRPRRTPLQQASATYSTVALGLAATTADQYFKVPEAGYLQLYRNSNGAAEPIFKLASQEELVKLNAHPDPLLTSLIF